ncbi:hypothetical protein MRB53_019438 [Persea americana]|uniref:Uncharacterized protein n=1 Tax=Persea americana TaxID=3435 RepID=A0ACC2KY92_PERAE|nr:hypothetical protein MRB53_019438 [Persea americana]
MRELQLDSALGVEKSHFAILIVYDHQPPPMLERPAAPLARDIRELQVVVDGVVIDTEEASNFIFFFLSRFGVGIIFFCFCRFGAQIEQFHPLRG